MFKGWLLSKDERGARCEWRDLDEADLPAGDVEIDVSHSTINYKDALAITQRAPIVRAWPMVPGIDAAGTVRTSTHSAWREGDAVILNGWGAGESRWGGLAERLRIDGDGLVRVPQAFTPRLAMALGTAGYTAMLCVLRLEQHGLQPGDGEVLVTGATGGVGSVAVAVLAKLGYRVIGSTGKPAQADYLTQLGAAGVIDRAELMQPGKPLQKERWAGVVDAVGSHTLVNAIAQTRYHGVVAACGLAQGADLPATVMPFILRAVTLAGVESVMAAPALRRMAWQRLASDMDPALIELMTTEIDMHEVPACAKRLLDGDLRGRLVVRVQ